MTLADKAKTPLAALVCWLAVYAGCVVAGVVVGTELAGVGTGFGRGVDDAGVGTGFGWLQLVVRRWH